MPTLTIMTGKVCLSLALIAALVPPALAERVDPARSVVGENEDIRISLNFPQTKTGDLYIVANVVGNLYFLNANNQWVSNPAPHDLAQTYSGTKQIVLGNTIGLDTGIYPVYQIITLPNTTNIFDIRNWVGGFSGMGQTTFQVKLPAETSGDHNSDGWADDDSNRDGFHDDDSNRDGYHDDDLNRDGYHDDDLNRDGLHDDDLNRDGFHDDDVNRDGFHDDDSNRDNVHDDDLNHGDGDDDNSSQSGGRKK